MHALIAYQVAFCFLVLFVAGLFVTTLQRLSHQPTGFSTDRVLVLSVVAKESSAGRNLGAGRGASAKCARGGQIALAIRPAFGQ